MKTTPWLTAEPFRTQPRGYESRYGNDFGTFEIPHSLTNVVLRVLASSAESCRSEGFPAWDHVSVSLRNRCPNWPEMEFIKRLFFRDDEAAMQLHVPVSDHRSFHPYCLHIWRPGDQEIPLPPGVMVAPDTFAGAST